mmetsp:Transcript_28359/g.62312  ORF Transcript_28359/g.62312 Transcript_28359/m.62312 type:complete len:82 (+) Transcript_28359:757-1002(+)
MMVLCSFFCFSCCKKLWAQQQKIDGCTDEPQRRTLGRNKARRVSLVTVGPIFFDHLTYSCTNTSLQDWRMATPPPILNLQM